jgi:FAD binding domain/Berberine and berberine like
MTEITKTNSTGARSALAAAHYLRAVMQGNVLLPGDRAYTSACQIWNGAVDHRPALFALCRTVEDVQAAVRTARAHGLPLSVRGGGHDWAGRALRHDGLVVDLSGMRGVEIDPQARVAKVGGGATAIDLIAAAAPHELGAITGTVGAVGMVGMTLGGGYGPLTSQYGLALDNFLEARVVLADGQVVVANGFENAELFWALRGGGGNFGVVVSMSVRLHPIGKLLAGLILFPWSEAESVLRGYAEKVASAPDELTVIACMLSCPSGEPVLFLAPTWSGEPSEGEQIIAGLQTLGTPILVHVGPMSCGDLLAMHDTHVVNGRHYAVKTHWISAMTPEVISKLVAAGTNRTSPFTAIAVHHFHGAATRVPLDATAFGLRREHFLVEITAAWEPGDNFAIHRQWAQNLSRALAPAALPGGYPNLLGPEELDRVAQAYGDNIGRLQEVKRRFDPEWIFSATPLPREAAKGCDAERVKDRAKSVCRTEQSTLELD